MSILATLANLLDPPTNQYLHDPTGWVNNRLHEQMWSAQIEILESVRDHRRTAVHSAHACGKCVADDATITLADGTTTTAANLVGRTFVIPSWSPDGSQSPAIATAEDNGDQQVWRVTTSSGRQIDRTGNHPLYAAHRIGGGSGRKLTVEPVGWREVNDLTTNDLVLVPERLTVEGRLRRPDDEVMFLGYMLGDGGTTQGVVFTQEEGPAKDEFRRIAQRLGGQVREDTTRSRYSIEVRGPDGGRFGRRSTNPMINMIREWGLFGCKAVDKRFPPWVWTLPNDQLAMMLNRLFACDGWASVPNRTRGNPGGAGVQIAIGLSSEGLIRDVELAMLRLGILGAVRARTSSYDDSGRRFPSWVWTISRLEDLRAFADRVGILGKEEAVARVVNTKQEWNGRASHWMRSEAPPGYRWERITSIESRGVKPTVAISVPGPNAYVTTFVEHNSHLASRVAGWWIDCHPPGTAFVVTTAPTYEQVRAILWRYIGQMFRRADLVGRVNQTEWWIGDELVGYGRKPADHDNEGFQGIHAKYVLVIVDEAAGIPTTLWTAILALLTTAECRVLAIGNPDYEGSAFSKMCAPGSGWHVIHIDGLATPNFTGETPVPGLLDQTWIDDLVADYGADSPQYVAKVRGLFPSDRATGVIPWSWAHRCRGVEATERVGPLRAPVHLGVDVGGGADLTVIRERTGPVVGRRWTVNTDDSELIVDAIIAAVNVTGASEVKIDVGGIGFGVVGSVRRRLPVEHGLPVTVSAVNFGATAKDPTRFVNVRAELWWEGRLRSQQTSGDQTWDLTGADDRTMADLTEPQWFETRDGRVQVEAKAEVRKRLGRSPDDGDALLLAFYDPPAEAVTVDVAYRNTALDTGWR